MKKILLFLSAFILLYGCAMQKGSPSTELDMSNKKDGMVITPPIVDSSSLNKNKDYLEIGFELMKTEKIGGIYYSMLEADVVQLLGEPSIKGTPELWDADGLYHWDYTYSKIGTTISFASEENNSGKILSYSIDSKLFSGSTTRNIRIGSKKQEVLNAYKNEIDLYEIAPVVDPDKTAVAGTVYGGIIFQFSDKDEVISIFVGAAAE